MSPEQFYQNYLVFLEKQRNTFQQKAVKLPYYRLSIILIVFFGFYFLSSNGWISSLILIILGIIAFLTVVKIDAKNSFKLLETKMEIEVCKSELDSIRFNFKRGEDNLYNKLYDREHAFAYDLDVFGDFSLFNFLNRTTVNRSAKLLQQRLLDEPNTEQIIERQAAIKELSLKNIWRIKMQVAGKLSLNSINQEKISTWLNSSSNEINKRLFFVAKILPFITFGFLLATFFGFSAKIAAVLIFIHILLIGIYSKRLLKIYFEACGVSDLLKQYALLVELVENENFENDSLKELTSVFKLNQEKASVELKKLSSIINNLDLKNNIYFWLPLNILFFWDFNYTNKLLKWKKNNGSSIEKWMEVICELEVLNSVAAIHYNYPHWVLPKINVSNNFVLKINNCGHPLLNETKCVKNSLEVNKNPFVVILTGSNMSGKSTFLRTIGTNIILAKMGCVVCASEFEISNFKMLTSMRIADDLANDTSTFYAELKRLKMIVEQLNAHPNTFVMLDEILRGTNSIDRHKGAEALIKQIVKKSGVSIVATHDIALSELKKEYTQQIENYHFDVSVNGEELYFDYKLKHGVCTSMNASILMKKMGIEL